MIPSTPDDPRRSIPSVDELLAAAELSDLRSRYGRFPWTLLVRRVVDDYRRRAQRSGTLDREEARRAIVAEVRSRMQELLGGGLRRVINGTGVVLHTNLGRAVLGEGVRRAAAEAMQYYTSLEVTLDTGRRSHRGETLLELIRLLTGAEAAMLVNNNAAAVYLVVNTYSPPGRVIVSRGELVEIGGSFRLPAILERAAGEVVEVGTTNRTYADDYARAASAGDILLKAHRSNYEIQGFTHECSLVDLVGVAREKGCTVVYDLGSGSLFDFAGAGIEGEEEVRGVLASGVDCVTMSGDKLLGGVQAGIIVGTRNFLDKLRDNPLRRALRVDKTTIAALQVLMRAYLFADDPAQEVPVLRQATASVDELRARARTILSGLPESVRRDYGAAVVDDPSAIGGGSFAVREVGSAALSFRCASEQAASELSRRLRLQPLPVIARIKGEEVRVNLRSVLDYEDGDLTAALAKVLGPAEAGGR